MGKLKVSQEGEVPGKERKLWKEGRGKQRSESQKAKEKIIAKGENANTV